MNATQGGDCRGDKASDQSSLVFEQSRLLFALCRCFRQAHMARFCNCVQEFRLVYGAYLRPLEIIVRVSRRIEAPWLLWRHVWHCDIETECLNFLEHTSKHTQWVSISVIRVTCLRAESSNKMYKKISGYMILNWKQIEIFLSCTFPQKKNNHTVNMSLKVSQTVLLRICVVALHWYHWYMTKMW